MPTAEAIGIDAGTGTYRLAFRLWARDTAAQLGIGKAGMALFGVATAIGAVVFVVAGLTFAGDVAAIVTGDPAAATGLARSLGHGMVLTAVAVGAVFGVLTADSSAMEVMLQIAGAPRRHRIAMLFAPTATLAAAVSLAAAAPTLVPAARAAASPGARLAVAACLAVTVIAATFAALGIHKALAGGLRRRLMFPLVHANAVAAAALVAVAVAVSWPSIVMSATTAAGWRGWLPGEVAPGLLAWSGAPMSHPYPSPLGVVIITAVLVAVAVLAVLLGTAETPDASVSRHGLAYVELVPPRRRLPALVWFEWLTLLRAPTTLMTALGVAGATLVAVGFRNAAWGGLLGAIPIAIAGAVGIRAVGHNLPSSWLVWMMYEHPHRWALAKVAAAFLTGLLLALPAAAVLTAFSGPSAGVGLVLPVFVPVLSGTLLAGAVVPASDQQPLSTAVSGAVSVVLIAAVGAAADRLLGVVGMTSEMGTALLAAVICIAATHGLLVRMRADVLQAR